MHERFIDRYAGGSAIQLLGELGAGEESANGAILALNFGEQSFETWEEFGVHSTEGVERPANVDFNAFAGAPGRMRVKVVTTTTRARDRRVVFEVLLADDESLVGKLVRMSFAVLLIGLAAKS